MKLMMIFSIWIIFILPNWVRGQEKNEKAVSSFSLLECSNKRELKLSDLVSKTRLVKLETNDSSLVGRDSRYLVGSKYIICITQSTILQFDSDGGFIRNVTQQGRGPGEFINVAGVDMDHEENNLFLTSSNSKMIQVVSLATGKYHNPIPIFYGETAAKIVVLNNRIAILPSIASSEKYLLYYQDLSGKFIEGIPITYKKIPQMILRSVHNTLSHGDNIYLSDSKVCGDTIFEVNGLNKTPRIIVSGGNDFGQSKANPTGYFKVLLSKTLDSWLFLNQLIEINNNVLTIGDVHYYIVDKNDSRLSEITEFTLDNLGKTYSYEELKKGFLTTSSSFDLTRDQFVFRIESIDFKKIVASNKMNVPENELKHIRNLDQEVSIYDNPILLIGNLK